MAESAHSGRRSITIRTETSQTTSRPSTDTQPSPVKQMVSDGQRVGWVELMSRPPLTFLRNYVLRRGVRDGVPGLIVSLMNSYYVFLKFAKLWAYRHANGERSDP